MGTIQQLYEAFQNVNLKEELPNLILQTSFEIDVFVQVQLDQGLLSTGEPIAPSYASDYYAKKKNNMNGTPGFGTPDLHYTGAYYKGIGVSIKNDTYDIESNVSYAHEDSISQYGDDLLRLSEEHKEQYANESLLPAIGNYIKEKTGLEIT